MFRLAIFSIMLAFAWSSSSNAQTNQYRSKWSDDDFQKLKEVNPGRASLLEHDGSILLVAPGTNAPNYEFLGMIWEGESTNPDTGEIEQEWEDWFPENKHRLIFFPDDDQRRDFDFASYNKASFEFLLAEKLTGKTQNFFDLALRPPHRIRFAALIEWLEDDGLLLSDPDGYVAAELDELLTNIALNKIHKYHVSDNRGEPTTGNGAWSYADNMTTAPEGHILYDAHNIRRPVTFELERIRDYNNRLDSGYRHEKTIPDILEDIRRRSRTARLRFGNNNFRNSNSMNSLAKPPPMETYSGVQLPKYAVCQLECRVTVVDWESAEYEAKPLTSISLTLPLSSVDILKEIPSNVGPQFLWTEFGQAVGQITDASLVTEYEFLQYSYHADGSLKSVERSAYELKDGLVATIRVRDIPNLLRTYDETHKFENNLYSGELIARFETSSLALTLLDPTFGAHVDRGEYYRDGILDFISDNLGSGSLFLGGRPLEVVVPIRENLPHGAVYIYAYDGGTRGQLLSEGEFVYGKLLGPRNTKACYTYNRCIE